MTSCVNLKVMNITLTTMKIGMRLTTGLKRMNLMMIGIGK